MRRSLNEVQALVLKAGRGAGLPLGLAQDLAAAVPWMGQAIETLPEALQVSGTTRLPERQPDALVFEEARAVMDGPCALDLARAETGQALELRNLDAPEILQALISCNRAVTGKDMVVEKVGPEDLRLTARSEDLEVAPSAGRPPLMVGQETWTRLEKLAAKTFVPESESSRASGAGAGLSDND
ncbi:MAG: DUF3726 domain-containing protein [Litoreibacter sp.]|nr:DUF3726 domain-containing protein [Litoreibacter sp.]